MAVGTLLTVARATAEYYAVLLYCLATRCNIERAPLLQRDTPALVHVYALARTLLLWHAPHYRAPTFAHDLRANLANVAIPGTGARYFKAGGAKGAAGFAVAAHTLTPRHNNKQPQRQQASR